MPDDAPPPGDSGDGDGDGDGDGGSGDDGPPGMPPPDPVPACVEDLRHHGHLPVCSSCACGRCASPAEACLQGPSDQAGKCLRAAACQQHNGCSGMECYCGPGVDAVACPISPAGPCKDVFEEAAGVQGFGAVQAVIDGGDQNNPLVRAGALAGCALDRCSTQCGPDGRTCTFEDEACQERYCEPDPEREQARADSAAHHPTPMIDRLYVEGELRWQRGEGKAAVLSPGATVTLEGQGFGAGPDIDFSKIMIGNSRVLETDLKMYEQELDITTQTHHELPEAHSSWDRDIITWTDERIEFRVPVHASSGPLIVQVQKRVGTNESLVRHGEPHLVVDALTLRITDPSFDHQCDVVSELSAPKSSKPIPVEVENPEYAALVEHGRRVFWAYDFNIGVTHAFRGLDWDAIFAYETTDPMTGMPADPQALFGAVPLEPSEVPAVAHEDVHFDPYPQPNPVPGLLLSPQKQSGWTRGTDWVGYRYAESSHPFDGPGEWIGFNCASCHGYPISYEAEPGKTITRVFPGLPNPNWSMKWSVLGEFEGISGTEPGPPWAPGEAEVDKTSLIYAMPPGAGEHNMVRWRGEGSHTDNDYQFSPIAIPNVTNHMPIRRPLSHTESYVGFEGSYIHSQEPDGALGSMRAEDLQALTAYMTQLDRHDDDLRNVGIYRWLAHGGELETLAGEVSEGEFVQQGWASFPELAERVAEGQEIFERDCTSCHGDALGAHTGERMIRLDQVGRFFEPTVYHRNMQSIRTSFLRNLYWVQHRGLLSDGHVRNLEDLVDPDRCREGTELYDRYYTLHPPDPPPSAGPDFPPLQPGANPRGDVFRVVRFPPDDPEAEARNRFVERYRYFVEVPWDEDHFYWDYQKMRDEYGPQELGTATPIGMPAAPHPWCAAEQSEVEPLVLYLLTL